MFSARAIHHSENRRKAATIISRGSRQPRCRACSVSVAEPRRSPARQRNGRTRKNPREWHGGRRVLLLAGQSLLCYHPAQVPRNDHRDKELPVRKASEKPLHEQRRKACVEGAPEGTQQSPIVLV